MTTPEILLKSSQLKSKQDAKRVRVNTADNSQKLQDYIGETGHVVGFAVQMDNWGNWTALDFQVEFLNGAIKKVSADDVVVEAFWDD